MIKAIETQYKDYRFRSRLEARWAVFFDALGLKWEYEPEGFELPSGRYLPDFRIPATPDSEKGNVGLYLEIKGIPPKQRDLARARDFSKHNDLLILHGTFDDPEEVQIVSCTDGEFADSRLSPTADWPFFMRADPDVPFLDKLVLLFAQIQPNNVDYFRIEGAVKAARSARFEFGETPRFAQ